MNGSRITRLLEACMDMDDEREGMIVAALAAVCFVIALAHMLAYILGRWA